MTVSVVRCHERRLAVLTELLDQHRPYGVRRSLAVEVLTEAVAHAILSSSVVRARNAGDIETFFALGELVKRDSYRTRSRPGHQHDLVLVDKGLFLLHRLVRLGGAVSDDKIDLLAQQALAYFGRNFFQQRVAVVDVLDRKLPTLELVFALHGVGAGARHSRPDINGVALRAFRPGADRRVVAGCKRLRRQDGRQQSAAGNAGARLQ